MNALTIADTAIRTDDEGRYCLNDLHRASGEEVRHRPGIWLRNDQTKALAAEIEKDGIPSFLTKQGLGTFVAKELVYAYATWISPAFHLKVIRAYDALTTQPAAPSPALPDFSDPAAAARAWAEQFEQRARLALENQAKAQALAIAEPKAQALDRIANANGLLSLRETATTLQVPERKFILWMQRHDWLYRRPGKGTLLGYAARIKDGLLEHKAVTIHNDRTGEDEIREQVRVTPRGLTVLAKRLADMQEAAPG